MSAPKTGLITEHFSWEEANCRCGCLMPDKVAIQIPLTAEWLEQIRAGLGNRPMEVISWYRCPKRNAAVKGVPTSQHLLGKAVDFTMMGLSANVVQQIIRSKGLFPKLISGFGQYGGSTHIDRRSGPSVAWGPKPDKGGVA